MTSSENIQTLQNKPIKGFLYTTIIVGSIFILIGISLFFLYGEIPGVPYLLSGSMCLLGAWFFGYYQSPSQIELMNDHFRLILRYRKNPVSVRYEDIQWIGRQLPNKGKTLGGGLKLKNKRLPFALNRETAIRFSNEYKGIVGKEAPYPPK